MSVMRTQKNQSMITNSINSGKYCLHLAGEVCKKEAEIVGSKWCDVESIGASHKLLHSCSRQYCGCHGTLQSKSFTPRVEYSCLCMEASDFAWYLSMWQCKETAEVSFRCSRDKGSQAICMAQSVIQLYSKENPAGFCWICLQHCQDEIQKGGPYLMTSSFSSLEINSWMIWGARVA